MQVRVWARYYRAVTQSWPWRPVHRTTCPGSRQSPTQERWAGGSHRHPNNIMSANRTNHPKGYKTYSESTSTPGATTVDFVQVRELTKSVLVAQRDVDETVVSESAHGRESGRFLATSLGASRDEQTGVLAPVTTSGPDATGLVPEGLPLRGEVTVASGDTEEDAIVGEELVRGHNGVGGLGGSVHLGQDIIGERLGDPMGNKVVSQSHCAQYAAKVLLEKIDLTTGSFNALLLGLSQLLDVAVQGVLEGSWVSCGPPQTRSYIARHTKTIAILGAMVKNAQLEWRILYIEKKTKTDAGRPQGI